VIESELQKRSDLRKAGLLITADPNAADLRMEVRRSNFTTEYPYVVIDTRTQIVVASGKVKLAVRHCRLENRKRFCEASDTSAKPGSKSKPLIRAHYHELDEKDGLSLQGSGANGVQEVDPRAPL
jgi:hypothetical protein